MDTVDKDNQNANESETPKVVSIQGETEAAGIHAVARTPIQLALAIRRHAKLGRARKEICHLENCTEKQFRYATSLLGKFPEKNAEAFGYYVMSVQAQIEEVEEAIQMALGKSVDKNGIQIPGDWKLLPPLHRVQKDLRDGIFDMAMKLGIVKKAAEAIDLNLRDFTVGFGDEDVKPVWPVMGEEKSSGKVM